MEYTKEVENMCYVNKGTDHGPAPIPEEGKWIQAKEIKRYFGSYSWYWMVCTSTGSV